MQDKKTNTGVIFPDDNGGQLPTSVSLPQDPLSNSQALSSDPINNPIAAPEPIKKSQNVLIRLMRRADVILALLLVLGGIGLTWRASSGGGEAANTVTSRFETTEIPLQELITEQGIDFGTQSVTINGPFQLNDTFVIAPSLQPSNATAGQIYYDQASNILNYYNGTAFVPLVGSSEQSSSFQSVGTGLALNNGQLSNTGVLSLQGQTGDVTLTAGNGIGITGTTITNNGVVSLVSGNETLIITDQGNGNLVLTVDVGGAGVTSLNGQAGALNLANASGAGNTITIDDASTSAKGIAQFNGTNFQAASGVINTIQNINTGATPTFAGVNTNSITPSAALTVGATGQQLTLQGNASTQLTATGGGFTTALGFTGVPVGNVTYNLDRAAAAGAYTICTTIGNCTGTGGGVSTSGGSTNRLAKFTGAQTIGDSSISDDGTNVTASSDLIIQGGDVTVGVVSTQTGTINLAHSGSSFLGSFVQGALTDNRQYLLPDAGGTVCLSTGNCSGSGSANTLQAAYDAGNTITTSNARNVAITMADSATDSNFLINLECDTACGANGRFAIQDDAVDVFTISPAGGAVNFINGVDSTQAFNIEENGGGNLFTVDTVNSRVGINLSLNNTPTLASGREGLELRGALRITGSEAGTHTDLYVTPNGSTESAKINVVNYDVPQFGQVIAVGLTSGSHADARAIGVYDDRTGNHQPSISVFDVSENDAFGLSWEGTSTDAYLKTLGSDVNIRINTTDAANFTASAVNLLQNTSVTGTLAVSAMGATDTSSYLCRNTLNQLSTCASTGAGSAFVQFGNSFGATAVLGTNDANALEIETSGVTRLTVAANGSNVTLASNTDLLLQGATAYISNPQAQTNGESFGLNASVTGANGTAIGNGAVAVNNAVSVGYLAGAAGGAFGGPVSIGEGANGGSWGVAVGQDSSTTGNNAVAIGNAATAAQNAVALGMSSVANSGGIAIGHGANTGGNDRIVIGVDAAATADRQMVIGSNTARIDHAIIGNGVTNATPLGFRLQTTSGSGTNVAGANLDIAAGQGTGSANGGSIAFLVSAAGGAGTVLNPLITVATIQGGTGAATFTNAANSTSAFNVENSSGSNLFTIDTVNSRVGINLGGNNVPSINGDGLEINGGLKVSGSGQHTFLTPGGASIDADLSINAQTVSDFDQVVALGLNLASADTARGIMVADARTVVHQPTIAVLSPNENEIGGFSWDGSSANFLVKNTNTAGTVGLSVGGTTRLQATSTGASVTGIATVSTLGTASNSTYLCHNGSNQIASCNTTGAGATFVQGGNSFGGTATLGTNDGFGLNFEVNTTTVMTISTVGAVNFQNQTNSVNAFRIQNADASATLVNADTTNLRVGIGGTASFSRFEVIDGDAAIYNSGANPRLILGDSTTAGQNGFMQWDSTNDYIRIETVGTNGLKIKDNFVTIGNLFPDQPLKIANGTTLLAQVNTTGEAMFQNSSNASDAFQVLNASGVPILTVDTADSVLRMGGTDTGIVMLGATNEPSSPAAGEIRIYGKSLGGRLFPKWKAPAGTGYAMQTAIFGASVGMILPQSNGNVSNVGLPVTFSGIGWPNLASTNMHTSMKRNSFTTGAGADSAAAIRSHESLTWRGNAAGLGGFFYSSRFAVSTTVTNQRIFVGLHDTTGAIAGNQVISNLTNMIGFGWDSADTNLQVMHNDAAGTATKVDLGASFPANNTTAVYEVRLFAAPNGSTVAYEVTRLDTGTIATGTLSTNLPASTTFLTQHLHINNGGTASAATLDMMHIYLETDY